jgi:catechol 2,3-dioxygenase-like lactoylglutathione lyase family enzyme
MMTAEWMPMPRGLDHMVHAVRDLDAAAALYRRLGFTVGARNRHPWGTQNHIVQLPGFFIELLAIVEPEKLGDDGFSEQFGKFNQRFLARQEGLSFLMLESEHVAADAAEFRSAGIGASAVLTFEREGAGPDGTKTKLGFSLVFARDPLAPDIGFAISRSLNPQQFWNPEFQRHPNGVIEVGGAVLVAENPSDHHIFLSAFTGIRDLQATSSGIVAHMQRGDVRIMDPAAFADRYGFGAPDISSGPRLAALRFTAKGQLERALEKAGIAFSRRMDAIIVPPASAMGATLVFQRSLSGGVPTGVPIVLP